MKLAIATQIRENYGVSSDPYWKCKGGNTYVVPNLTVGQSLQIKESGIADLIALIEQRNPMFEEYVVDWNILDNDVVVCDEWETPFELCQGDGRWVARCTTRNDAYGDMHNDIAVKTEFYVMGVGGTRSDYVCYYIMRNGDVVDGADFNDYMKKNV